MKPKISKFHFDISRGAPHIHSLLWLEDANGVPAPTFWTSSHLKKSNLPEDLIELLRKHAETEGTAPNDAGTEENSPEDELEEKKRKISEVAAKLVFGSIDDAKCRKHHNCEDCEDENGAQNCSDCQLIRERVEKFNQHSCTFTCHKKKKYIIIQEDEGHGRFDKRMNGPKLECQKCRFNVPFFPLDETTFLQGITKDFPEEEVKKRKEDLRKIRKFLLRQTNGRQENSASWAKFKSLSFREFLHEVGMFETEKDPKLYTESEKQIAKARYINALTASIRGTGSVFLKRQPQDCFTNNFNPNLMLLHAANHDIQIVVDQYACAQYICGYLTKQESGMSQLLKNINDNAENLSQMDLINKLSAVLDQHREISIQEAVYRMMGFPMAKSSIKIKYLSTMHPNFRDGLLKNNLEELDDDEPIFHNSPHTYYEHRPIDENYNDPEDYDPVEREKDFWKIITLSEFWSWYEIIYDSTKKKIRPRGSHELLNGLGYIKRRKRQAVLRYYLSYENIEDYCRGLLTLFFPYRNEMEEIHEKDVKKLVIDNEDEIFAIKDQFEAHEIMTEIIKDVQKMYDEETAFEAAEDEDEENLGDTDMFTETTEEQDIQEFEKWARKEAEKNLKNVKEFTNVQDITAFRQSVVGLNIEQRKIFDDIIEREITIGDERKSSHLFISGEAGTGKSYLMRVMMEGTKLLNVKSGSELNKPAIISMAPTATAAFIIGGKTIDSALCFNRNRNYSKLSAAREANLKFMYEDVTTLFCDEVSMVGSTKLTKIHFRMQDLADGDEKYKFMGGRSCVVTGDFFQLPPVKDKYAFENNHLDGRPTCSPSHWDENFSIYYLQEKIRSMQDPTFGEVCDRIAKGCLMADDEAYLRKLVRKTPKENDNEAFKTGKISVIVTNNKKREKINLEKLEKLLPDNDTVFCKSQDQSMNVSNPPELTDDLNYTVTGNLQKSLKLKVGAPIMLTVNHSKPRYREDGVCNGARAYIDSFQLARGSTTEVRYIWVVFKDPKMGQQLKFDNRHLLELHRPNHARAVPLQVCKTKFNVGTGNVSYHRTQFPAILAYAVTSHRSQGDTLEEVIIDYTSEGNEMPYVIAGSFYVAITRATCADNVFLADFQTSYIKCNKQVMSKIEAMRKFRQYIFKKIYLEDEIFISSDKKELKAGYLNINDLTAEYHAEYLNGDKNLQNLDILVIADTRLTEQHSNSVLSEKLDQYSILKRCDAKDSSKHMGLLVLGSKGSRFKSFQMVMSSFREKVGDTTYIQGVHIRFEELELKLAFLYINQKPREDDVQKILQHCHDSSAIFGDLNLDPRNATDKRKLDMICGDDKYLALNDITTDNYRQLDHVIAHKSLKLRIYATSYFNFVSDHKSITMRIGFENNKFTKGFLEKISCNEANNLPPVEEPVEDTPSKSSESLFSKPSTSAGSFYYQAMSTDSSSSDSEREQVTTRSKSQRQRRTNTSSQEKSFETESEPQRGNIIQRRIRNPDASSCWLNCCLQLMLTAMDAFPAAVQFDSQLGYLLTSLQNTDVRVPLDPSEIRVTLTKTYDEEIEDKLENIMNTVDDPEERRRKIRGTERAKLNIGTGQQCVEDFFVVIRECREHWLDIYTFLNYSSQSSVCCHNCGGVSAQEVEEQLYCEVDCPPDNSSLSVKLNKVFNEGEKIHEYRCERGCTGQALQKKTLQDVTATKFLTVFVTRTRRITQRRFEIITADVSVTENITLVDLQNNEGTFEPICVLQHLGQLRGDGSSSGHYIADVRHQGTNKWFTTSDNDIPKPISSSEVSKRGSVILYKNINI